MRRSIDRKQEMVKSFNVAINYAKIWAKRHAELIPSLHILHAQLLGRVRNTRAYMTYGVVKNSDCSMPILFLGDRVSATAFASFAYSQVERTFPVGKCPILQIDHFLPREFPGMIVICERADAPLANKLLKQGYLLLPIVDLVLDLSLPTDVMIRRMSRRRRRDIKDLESQGYSYSISQDTEDFDYFYWKMYVPYLRNRFGEGANIRPYLELKATFRMNGGMIFVKKGEKRVAGMLFKTVRKTLTACCVGVYEGDFRFIKDLAGQAALFFLIKWAKMKGFVSLNYGACMPFLRRGLFTYKREWGMEIQMHEDRMVRALKLSSLSEGALAFLQQNPFLLLDKGALKAVLFVDHVPSESELLKAWSDNFSTNLNSLIVIARHKSDTCDVNHPKTSQCSQDTQIALGKPLQDVCNVLQKCGYDVDVFELRDHGKLKVNRMRLRCLHEPNAKMTTPQISRGRDQALNLHAGETVEVRSENEILVTLGEDGTLEGLPFVPEMSGCCGKRFRVLGQVNRIVVEGIGPRYARNMVMLDGVRCSGEFHGGCNRTCMLLWKEAWLKPVQNGAQLGSSIKNNFSACCPSIVSNSVFSCQLTDLVKATSPIHPWSIQPLISDIKHGAFNPLRCVQLLSLRASLLFKGFIDKRNYAAIRGKHGRTPTINLNLQSGEIVEVKSKEEIMTTLDSVGKNRGLIFSREMLRFCGNRYRVLKRIDKMINEKTGEMRNIGSTVILDKVICEGKAHGGCQRGCYCLWREIWLKRV